MKSFFYLIDNDELSDKAYDYLLSLCDGAEFLYSDYGKEFTNVSVDLECSGYEKLVTDIRSTESGVSWGMHGDIVTFEFTANVKRLIKQCGLSGIIRLYSGVLENLTLYDGKKVTYSVCSHEGYTDIDKEFETCVSDFCFREIENTGLFKKLHSINSNNTESVAELRREFIMLNDLSAYVDDELKPMIYSPPRYKLKFSGYRKLAKKYFTQEAVEMLDKFNSYKDMYPYGYPHTLDEVKAFNGVPSFKESEIYRLINKQLTVLEVVFYKLGKELFPLKEPPESFKLNLVYCEPQEVNKLK